MTYSKNFFFWANTHSFHIKVYTSLEEVKLSNERVDFATESAITILERGTYEKEITSNKELKWYMSNRIPNNKDF